MEEKRLEMLKQLAAGIAAQFGSNCEVVIHDVSSNHPDHSIVHIENGHVSGRKVGDGASQVVLDQMATQAEHPRDHLCYLTRTPDGKILKSSTLYIRNRRGAVTAIFSINYDVSICCPPRTRSRRSPSASSTSTTSWTSSSSSPWPWWASPWP